MRLVLRVATLAFLLSGTSAEAVESSDEQAIHAWRQMAEADLEAAYLLLRDNHPAAVPSLGDVQFRENLEHEHDIARQRAATIGSYQGYLAVLAGFATSFGDEHIWTNPKLRGVRYRWAGLVMARRGSKWIVATQDKTSDAPDLVGASLVSCDGVAAEAFAARSLGFRVSAPIEAQYVAHGAFMLVDDGNPFIHRPNECTFESESRKHSVTLDWREVATPLLAERLQASLDVDGAGFGIRTVDDMTWISMERLSAEAQPVLDDFRTRREQLLRSPALVIDVRGNGGGNSRYGRELATLIYGDAYVDTILVEPSTCGAVWRASPGNAAALRAAARTAPEPDTAEHYTDLAARMETAISKGQAFETPLPECESRSEMTDDMARGALRPDYDGRVILLTDHACFSSCLLMTSDFRKLGALHVGAETNAATRYMEVREIELPSGLSTFTTLQKVQLGGESTIGPFTPNRVAPNGTGDTKALEDWIATLK